MKTRKRQINKIMEMEYRNFYRELLYELVFENQFKTEQHSLNIHVPKKLSELRIIDYLFDNYAIDIEDLSIDKAAGTINITWRGQISRKNNKLIKMKIPIERLKPSYIRFRPKKRKAIAPRGLQRFGFPPKSNMLHNIYNQIKKHNKVEPSVEGKLPTVLYITTENDIDDSIIRLFNMSSSKATDERTQLANVSDGLKDLAVKLNIPVITAQQINRSGKEESLDRMKG